MNKSPAHLAVIGAAVSLSACGTITPRIDPSFDDEYKAGFFISQVVNNVRCQLGNAVIQAEHGPNPPWLKDWAAEITLNLNISEKTGVSPGITATSIFPSVVNKFTNGTTVTSPQSFTFGLGGSYTQTATRIVALTWYDVFSDFHSPPNKYLADCDVGSGIKGDLKLGEVLFAVTYAGIVPNNMSQPFASGGPYSNAQDTITFEIDANASATPSWKYVNVTNNGSGSLLSVDRDRKDQLLITIGPSEIDKKARKLAPRPSNSAVDGGNSVSTVHNIGRITLPLLQ